MITCRRHIALIALCLAESCASGARQPEAPPTAVAPARVGIVIDDSGRTRLQESFANAVVSHLEALATSGNLQVIPRRDIDASLMTEIPPRWEGNDAREVGKLLRAIVMVDVSILETRPLVTGRALATYVADTLPNPLPDTLLVVGATVDAVADGIARRVATEILPHARIEAAYLARHPRRPGRTAAPSIVLIDAFRTTDTLSGQVAILLRSELAQRLPGRASVVRKRDIDATKMQGYPSNDPWSLDDIREIAKLLRADIVLDVRADASAGQVTIASYRSLPPSRAIDTLPRVQAPSIESAVRQLAREIARDTLFRR